ncbi:hypothetical protein MSG28_012043 [Choristoneura fumiferana]|uniref:Uncharacterized protein n=1 Tax=Choristoneura fumiferana TaxID=7141 RepID=A0ACC0KNJ0_CHOFU|nr:hypothetical protein MSG28_012043 [Choristoneura fumiferana]
MQGFKTFVLLAVMVVLFGLVRAAPADHRVLLLYSADNELTGLEQLSELAGMEQLPELLVWPSPAALSAPAARRCTAIACRSLCRALGWWNGVCLDAVRCRCSNLEYSLFH